jgi:hypothetical protein
MPRVDRVDISAPRGFDGENKESGLSKLDVEPTPLLIQEGWRERSERRGGQLQELLYFDSFPSVFKEGWLRQTGAKREPDRAKH